MAITAIVALFVSRINGIPAVTLPSGVTRYARVSFQVSGGDITSTGRSAPIPDAGGSFASWFQWGIVRGLSDSDTISITVAIQEDHGDFGSPPPIVVTGVVSGPYTFSTKTVTGLGSGPTFDVLISCSSFITTDWASIARSIKQKGVSGTLAITKGFLLEFESIDGLYKPDLGAVVPAPGSKPVAGYISRDDLGRIFTNRRPDGTWQSDTQYIDVKLKITAFGGAKFTSGILAHWYLTDEDDPTNDSDIFHRDWGPYVDPNDYDPAGNPTGAASRDNAGAFSPGNVDEDLLLGASVKGVKRWANGIGGEAASGISLLDATSPITVVNATLATSTVRIHCPNVLGTNFSLRADLDGTPSSQVFSDALTGVMTMWSRLDVEVATMAGAFPLAGALPNIPSHFVPMCVQLDFQNERIVGGPLDMPSMVTKPDERLDTAAAKWVSDPGVFSKMGQRGWFFLGGARFSRPPVAPGPGAKPLKITDYKFGVESMLNPTLNITQEFAWVEVPGKFKIVRKSFLIFHWTDAAGRNLKASFVVVKSTATKAGKTRVTILGNDVTPGFTGWDTDGSLKHSYLTQIMYFPNHHRLASAVKLSPGGFGIPAKGAKLTVFAPGVATGTDGISPTVQDALGEEYFVGQTVIFTHFHGSGSPPTPDPDFDSSIVQTVVHEFIHAFGMPHKCGYWDWRTPRLPDGKSCCMNYFNTWLIDRATISGAQTLIPGLDNRQGPDVCGRHLMEVRRVHLERNVGLRWT